jgi:hypothetical protein
MADRARDLSHPLGLLGAHLIKEAVRDLHSGASGVQARHATSGLAGSMTFHATATTLDIGSNKAYGLYQQFGAPPGGVQAKKPGGYLTIPIGENVSNGRGDPVHSQARDVPGGFVWRNPKSGKLFIASKAEGQKRRKRAGKKTHPGMMIALADQFAAGSEGLKLWFLLVKSVKGIAHNFCRFEEERDRPMWNRYSSDWLLSGM